MMVRELVYSYKTTRTEGPVVQTVTPAQMAEWIRPMIESEAVEVVMVVVLNTRRQPVCWHVVSRGTVDRSLVHPRDVFRPAITANGSAVVLVHNHPSGDTTPSPDDLLISRRLHEAGVLLGIDFLDSLIIVADGFLSLRESGFIG